MWLKIKSLVISRVGPTLFLSNLGLLCYFYFFSMRAPIPDSQLLIYFVGNGGFIAGRWVDFNSSLLTPLMMLHLLPLLISNVVMDNLIKVFPPRNAVAASWIYAYLLITLIYIQWLVVGVFIERIIKTCKDFRPDRVERLIKRK